MTKLQSTKYKIISKELRATAQKAQEHGELIAKAKALKTVHFSHFAKELKACLFSQKLVEAQAKNLEKLRSIQDEIEEMRRKLLEEGRKKGLSQIKKTAK